MFIESGNIKFFLDEPRLEIGKKNIILNRTDFKPSTRIYFKITNSCNFNCTYCFQKNDPDINEKVNLKEYRILLDKYISESGIEIIIFGGEPLLNKNKENLIFLFDICNTNNGYFFFTNGCFSKEIGDILVNNRDKINMIIISIDGPEFIHNRRRPLRNGNSYQAILDNANYLYEHEIPFSFQYNIDVDNINYLDQGLTDLDKKLGLNNLTIILNKVLHTKRTISELEFLKKYIELLSVYPHAHLVLNSVVYSKFNNVIIGNGFKRPRCNIENTLILDFPSKKVYICPESMNTEIGIISKNDIIYNNTKKKYTNVTNKELYPCNSCIYANYCKYGCAIDTSNHFKTCKDETYQELKFIIDNFYTFYSLE
ncbi:MAG: radical SAM protein [Firmicutes bacterium]|nr:radical SAM protein [Bacillota bacterium]